MQKIPPNVKPATDKRIRGLTLLSITVDFHGCDNDNVEYDVVVVEHAAAGGQYLRDCFVGMARN
jgi:hypothetical protein